MTDFVIDMVKLAVALLFLRWGVPALWRRYHR